MSTRLDQPRGHVVEPVLWVSPKSGLVKYSSKSLQALYGSHLITGNTLVELRLGGHYYKHPVYSYDGCYVFYKCDFGAKVRVKLYLYFAIIYF
jgi:hypothetical protein